MDEKTIPLKAISLQNQAALENKRGQREIDQFGPTLFEQTSECVFIIDTDLRYLAANRQALHLLGYEENELIGMHVSDVISMGELVESPVISEGTANIYERILKKKDGTMIPVEIGTSVVLSNNGEPSYIQSIVRDVSERKAIEKLLMRNGRILSVISEATARLFRSPNIESRISEMLESLGLTMEVFCCVIFEIDNFSGMPKVNIKYAWQESKLNDFDVETAIHPFIKRLVATPASVLSEKKVIPAENLPGYSFLAIPIQGALGSRGYLGMFDHINSLSWLPGEFDIVQTATNILGAALQRVQYEETIRINEFRNRAIIDAFPDLLIRIDSSGKILDYSSSPNHPLFVHRDIITGKNLYETWPEEIVIKVIGDENRKKIVASHWWEGFQLPFSSSIYESRLHPINQGEALIIIRDITDIIRLNEMKTDFINRASHELRTPLTSAILMTDLIQQGGTVEEQKEYWQILKNELNRQKNLIDRLLMAGRLESGMVKLESAALDLIPVLEESMQAVKPIANKKKIKLVLQTQPGPVNILGENSALQQIFINLITNSVKFSPEGGKVDLIVGKSKDYIDVSIVDQGMGISPEAVPHLFEKFYRARNVTVAEIPGSGIGLYIVKSIIEELHGKIDVRSEINKGTVFTVHLLKSPV